ncbi:MAG TPA: TonB-dependent receptor [Thiobacillus sp.]|nr:TonB-dependent receptor [Thiobacillus sp.]
MKNLMQPIALAVSSLFSLHGFAAERAMEAQLDEIVVSGSRAATKLSETPVAIGVVKRAVLECDKPKTMGEVINRVPGVYWNDLGNEQHSMSIRQPISTNSVYQYLEDGIPIRPLGVFNHNALNEINVSGVNSVEVVKGPSSSLYGSNAVGGAVNFLTASASRTPYAMIGVRHDSTAAFTRYDLGASNTWGDFGARFSYYGSRRDSNNWQEYSGGSKDSITLRGDYALSTSSQLRATLVHTDLDSETSGSLFENDYQTNPGKSINTFTYRKDKTTRANVAWEGETFTDGITTVTLFARENDHGQLPNYTIRTCSPNTPTCRRGTINNNHVESVGLDAKHQQEFSWLASRVVAGLYLDKSKNPYVSDNLDIVRDPVTGKYLSYTLSPTLLDGKRDYAVDIDNTAVFAQWEFSPLRDVRAVVGGRSDSIQYDFVNHLAPGGSPDFGAPNESRKFSRFSPKVGATYALSNAASLYANYSEGFTPPDVSQLYGKSSVPDLRPAVYSNYELGLRMAFLNGALKLDSAVYRLDGKDTIVSYAMAPGNSENRNAGRTRSQGIELGLSYDAGMLDMRLGTTLASHRFLQYQASSTLDYSGKDMPQAPSDITTAEIGYKPVQDVRVALEWVHLGEYWMNNANTVRYPGHSLFNLRGNYKFAKGWETWLQVRNLADAHYSDNASSAYSGLGAYTPNTQNTYTPGAPRSVMLGVSYAFGAN